MKVKAYYDAIYLVATQEERTSSHRVTEREGEKKPGTVQFTGNFPMENGEATYSTLVIDDAKWDAWFGKRKKLENMATPEVAAETLVSQHQNIYYGCPLCTIRGKVKAEIDRHVAEHINKWLSQFRVEVEE